MKKEEEKEKCVSCEAETPYSRNTHIDLREHYVECAGQLCKKCYDEIYKIKNVRENLGRD